MFWKMQNADHFFFNTLEQSKINADISKENQLFEGLVNNAPKEISTRKDKKGLYFAVFHCYSKISAICNNYSLETIVAVKQEPLYVPKDNYLVKTLTNIFNNLTFN